MKDVTKLNRRKTRCSQTASTTNLAVFTRGGSAHNDQTHCPDPRGFVISKEENPREYKENTISRYNVVVVCSGVVYEEYFLRETQCLNTKMY